MAGENAGTGQGQDEEPSFQDKMKRLVTKRRLLIAALTVGAVFLLLLAVHVWSFYHPTVYSGEFEVSSVSDSEQQRLSDTFSHGVPSGLKDRTDLHKKPDYTGFLSVTKTVYGYKDYQMPLDSLPTFAGMSYELDYGSASLSSTSALVSIMDGTQFKGACANLDEDAAQSCARQDALVINTGAVQNFLQDIGGYGTHPIITAYQADQIIDQMDSEFQAQSLKNEDYDDTNARDLYFDVGDYLIDVSYKGAHYKYYVDDFTMVNKKARQVVDDYAKRGEQSWKNPRFQKVFAGQKIITVPRSSSSNSGDDESTLTPTPAATPTEQSSESAGADTQDNPTTALSKAYWDCTPQSQQPNFEWNLSSTEDLVELMGTKDWSQNSLNRQVFGCFLGELDLPSTDIIDMVSNGNADQGYQTRKYGDYSVTWSTGEDGNVDITVLKGDVKDQ